MKDCRFVSDFNPGNNKAIITAGTFETSEKKALLLEAIDIATTASAEGENYGPLITSG